MSVASWLGASAACKAYKVRAYIQQLDQGLGVSYTIHVIRNAKEWYECCFYGVSAVLFQGVFGGTWDPFGFSMGF